jgi:TonB-dependent SusC/RagA subfamily outer membrane receptor
MKMPVLIKTVVLLLNIAVSFYSFGQEKTLVGKITTFDSIPLSGVEIEVKSTGLKILSDSLGRFQTFCNNEDKLIVRANGFYDEKVKIENGIRMIFINLKLKKGDKNLDLAENYVNIGYGTVSAKNLLSSVASLKENEIDFSVYTNIYDLIQGQFAGVTVEGNKIVIRGNKTYYGSESDAALLVVDGMIISESDFATISPIDIQSVDVLKDGSSSVYGSRGANGVVIVETKKGK